jgi:DNA-binding CsgD family transcriptional regulator/DNA-binding Lrp family transcriptional regulator
MQGDEEPALTLYQALRAQGTAASEQDHELGRAAGLDPDQVERALARLRRLGLVRGDGAPVEPDAALVTTMAAYQAHTAEQARNAVAFRELADSLLSVYRPAVAREASQVEVEYITGRPRKERALNGLNTLTRETCDSMHPGPMPPMEVLERSLRRDAAMIERGVRIRCLYPRAPLQGARYTAYLRELTGLGAQVRLIDHAPCDLLIRDGMTACLPADPQNAAESAMLLIQGAALVTTLSAVYEDYWLRATPYEQAVAGEPCSRETELSGQERVVIRLMAGGLSDDQIARKMGISRRTVQRAVTKLMARLQATSRFEAGLKLAQDPEFTRRPGPGTGHGTAPDTRYETGHDPARETGRGI